MKLLFARSLDHMVQHHQGLKEIVKKKQKKTGTTYTLENHGAANVSNIPGRKIINYHLDLVEE